MASLPVSQSNLLPKKPEIGVVKRAQAQFFPKPIWDNLQRSLLFSKMPKMVVAVASAGAGTAASSPEKAKKRYPGEAKGFVEEMKFVAMKLHSRDQAKEGEKDPQMQPVAKWEPTVEGYLKFLVDSKLVFDTLETAVRQASFPECEFLVFMLGTYSIYQGKRGNFFRIIWFNCFFNIFGIV